MEGMGSYLWRIELIYLHLHLKLLTVHRLSLLNLGNRYKNLLMDQRLVDQVGCRQSDLRMNDPLLQYYLYQFVDVMLEFLQ